ncbi:DnaB-like helicase N-terminal domain-containing protein [Streptomyces sp. NPDC057136]|uniref:DnaB-like helicase N-terminal domain-containing protein n=1 Tax=Streptomyces sp. NPDC057136 TaxID=3346029 RepID=UPI00362AEEC0
MPQWLIPNLPEGSLRTFNRELHTLHGKAGYPSSRQLYLAVGKVVSHTKIHHAFIKPCLPSWGVVDVVVEQLARQARPRLEAEAEINRFKRMWDSAHDEDVSSPPGAETSAPAATTLRAVASGVVPSTFRPGVVLNPNRLIYDAIIDLSKAGKPVSVPDVAAELDRRGQLELCGGEDYLFECVKVSIKGAHEAGMSLHDFAVMNARKMRAASQARRELLASVVAPDSDAKRVRRAFERVSGTAD